MSEFLVGYFVIKSIFQRVPAKETVRHETIPSFFSACGRNGHPNDLLRFECTKLVPRGATKMDSATSKRKRHGRRRRSRGRYGITEKGDSPKRVLGQVASIVNKGVEVNGKTYAQRRPTGCIVQRLALITHGCHYGCKSVIARMAWAGEIRPDLPLTIPAESLGFFIGGALKPSGFLQDQSFEIPQPEPGRIKDVVVVKSGQFG